MGVFETNTQGRSGIIYALNMMLLAGEPPKIGISFNPLLSLQPNRLPKFGKEKEPGILRMQADTVMLNPSSTSERNVTDLKIQLESAKQVLGSLNRSGSLIFEQTQRHKTVNL